MLAQYCASLYWLQTILLSNTWCLYDRMMKPFKVYKLTKLRVMQPNVYCSKKTPSGPCSSKLSACLHRVLSLLLWPTQAVRLSPCRCSAPRHVPPRLHAPRHASPPVPPSEARPAPYEHASNEAPPWHGIAVSRTAWCWYASSC